MYPGDQHQQRLDPQQALRCTRTWPSDKGCAEAGQAGSEAGGMRITLKQADAFHNPLTDYSVSSFDLTHGAGSRRLDIHGIE